jgi:hypothetical protein
MSGIRKRTLTFLGYAVLMLLVGAASSSSATASPAWYFDEEFLEGTETVANTTPPSYFTFPGLTIGCQPLPLEMTIKNEMGNGTGKVTGLPVGTCFTDSSVCTVEAFEPGSLPWNSPLKSVSSKSYLRIEGIHLSFLLGDEECPLYEVLITITGTAGGLVDNEAGQIVFSPSSFKATGTELKALGQKIEWNAALELKATGPHAGQQLTAH